MAPLTPSADRRRAPRQPAERMGWKREAVLRPGLDVSLCNISTHGVLVHAPARLRPGRQAELQLCPETSDDRLLIRGRIGRCLVVGLDPLKFEGSIEFEAPLEGPGESGTG